MDSYARTPKSIRRYNIFKAVVALILIAIIVILLLQGRPNARTTAELPSTPTVATSSASPPTPTSTIAATATPTEVPIETPMLAQLEVGSDGTVALQGTGTPGSTVEVWANERRLERVTVSADGHWSLDTALDPGAYTISARAVDADGKMLVESEPTTFEVAASVAVPTLALPEIDANGAVALQGTGTPGSTVEVWANGQRLDRVIVGDDGTWSFSTVLDPGEYDISVRAVDARGETVAESAPVEVVVEPPIVHAPTLTSPEAGEILSSETITLTGTGEPGTEVEILDQGEVIGTAVVQADGTWAFAYDAEPGAHTIAMRMAGEETLAGEAVAFEVTQATEPSPEVPDFAAMKITCGVDTAPEGIDLGDTYVVAPCEYMGLIASRTGVTLADLIAANPDIENPNLIFPGQIINLPPR